ncbi:MAG: hypothetical protein K6L60_04265 [Oceanobacter sp.]
MDAYHGNFYIDKKFIKVMRVVKKRPHIFMENPSPSNIRVFISGYASAYLFEDEIESQFFGGEAIFFDWMVEEMGRRTSPRKGWDKILSEESGSDQAGFDLFFKYLGIFIQE